MSNVSNGSLYSGATTSTLTVITPPTYMSGYLYQCVVSGSCNPPTASAPATLTINTIPSPITSQPSNIDLCVGSPAVFSVTVTSTIPATYQWYKDNVAITGATAPVLQFQGLNPAHAGSYYVVISNACGSVQSDTRTLTVKMPPAITDQPDDQTVCPGSPVTFSVVATGFNLSYQWKKNGSAISGATSSSYTIPSVASAHAGNYTVVVSGGCLPSPTTSTAAVLTVNSVPNITAQNVLDLPGAACVKGRRYSMWESPVPPRQASSTASTAHRSHRRTASQPGLQR